mgnify:CR=1 FL=1
MGSPFKMKPKSPMMKALVGKQGNLPQHLQDKILAAPETAKKGSPAKSYGSKKKSPVMQKETKGKRKFGEASVETREKQSIGKKGTGMQASAGQRKGKIGGVTVKANIGKQRGATDLLQVAKDSYSKAKKYVKGKLGISKIEPPKKGLGAKLRKPKIGKQESQKSQRMGPDYVGPKKPKRSPVRKMGVKALEAQRGTKNPSPIKKRGSGGRSTRFPKLAVRDKDGNLKAPRGPQSGEIGGVRVSIQTKGRSTKNTDLLPYLKGRGKGSGSRARKRNQRK